MKKFLFLMMIGCTALAYAQGYGILVNGTDYYPGTQNPAPLDPSFQEYMALNIALAQGDYAQLYDPANQAAWAVDLDAASVAALTRSGDCYNCSQTGCYDFYIKLKYNADQLYVGPGSNCSDDPATPIDPSNPGYTTSVPAQYPGVMLQGFYWDSYKDNGHGTTTWGNLIKDSTEVGSWFDLIWLPPSAKSSGGTGYIPQQYSNQTTTAWGGKTMLKNLIAAYHRHGARVVADIVVNHAGNKSGWCDFYEQDFGAFGKFQPTHDWICNTDEAITGGHCTSKGAADDGYGDEANYAAARDWDHNNAQVRDMIKAYLRWMRSEMGYDGWRYDYCKGFHNSHINDYNSASEAFFSVMEYWDGNPDVLLSHVSDAGNNTATFDFGVKYSALNNGIAAGNYMGCKGAGLLGKGKSRYSVTFVDSHDSYQRDGNEFMGPGNSMKNFDDKTLQANAYILSMPGVPCVFYPHWKTWPTEIKAMINARYKAGVHSESSVQDEAGNGYYKATISGTNGSIRLLLGPNSGFNTTPAGYTLAAKGTNWAVYYTENTPRGNKDMGREPIKTDVENVMTQAPASIGQKIMENGQIYLLVDGVKYSVLGQIVK